MKRTTTPAKTIKPISTTDLVAVRGGEIAASVLKKADDTKSGSAGKIG